MRKTRNEYRAARAARTRSAYDSGRSLRLTFRSLRGEATMRAALVFVCASI